MKIRSIVFIAALAAILAPLGVLAQTATPAPRQGGRPPEVRAKIQQLRAQAKTDALNDLSAEHRAKVQALIAQVQAGMLDPSTASSDIDSVLTPAETQAVLTEEQKMRAAVRESRASAGIQPQRRSTNRKPDAGRFLLMLSWPIRPSQ